jgi:hypothetical protein
LGDQAWGNGNWDASGLWNDRYPTANLNSRTISIEHHDNGGAKAGSGKKGVVPESVIQASIWLDKLLTAGIIRDMKESGIRFRDGQEYNIARELKAIPIDKNHIIDHNYIAGRLKPYCWRPWADDKYGFPQDRFISGIKSDVSAPVTTTGVDGVLVGEDIDRRSAFLKTLPNGCVVWEHPGGTGWKRPITEDTAGYYFGYTRNPEGWHGVEIFTGIPFDDRVVRPVIGYVEASVGEVIPAPEPTQPAPSTPEPTDGELQRKLDELTSLLATEKTKASEANLKVIKKDEHIKAYPMG